ncbi:hypothetical protein SAMN05216299_10711 [Nitrosospira sp. Nsp14]|nr:hypothetical protein SAMN05216299_10711 [Nitrosospira sp. Nsp14]
MVVVEDGDTGMQAVTGACLPIEFELRIVGCWTRVRFLVSQYYSPGNISAVPETGILSSLRPSKVLLSLDNPTTGRQVVGISGGIGRDYPN